METNYDIVLNIALSYNMQDLIKPLWELGSYHEFMCLNIPISISIQQELDVYRTTLNSCSLKNIIINNILIHVKNI